jgi:hypothetical protein
MTPWDIIEIALARAFRPPKSQQWLADSLHLTPQAIHKWQKNGVPPKRYRDVATLLGLTVDQLEGLAPLPWDRGWPFPDIEPERYYALQLRDKELLQRRVLQELERIERIRQAGQDPSDIIDVEAKPAPAPAPAGMTEAQRRLRNSKRGQDVSDDATGTGASQEKSTKRSQAS